MTDIPAVYETPHSQLQENGNPTLLFLINGNFVNCIVPLSDSLASVLGYAHVKGAGEGSDLAVGT